MGTVRLWRAWVVATMLMLLVAAVPAAAASPAEVTIIGRDYAFDMPSTLPAGLVHLTFMNQGKEEHEALFFLLKPGVTEAQLLKMLQSEGPGSGPPSGPPPFTAAGGAGSIGAGQRQEVYLTMQPGNYEVVCFDSGADNVPHVAKGMYKSFTVTGTAGAATPPAADGTVTLKDFAIGVPDVIRQAKRLTLQVVNNGPSEHEVMLFKLLPGKTVQDALAFAQSEGPQSGPPPGDAAGGLAAIASGSSGWMVLNLAPGNYFAACFVPDAQGKPHVADGMYASFTVAAAATTIPSAPPRTGTGGASNFIHRLGDG